MQLDLLHKISRLNQTLSVVTKVHSVLVNSKNEQDLYQGVCEAVVSQVGFPLAWVGIPINDDRKSFHIIASAGDAKSYLDGIEISWGDNPKGNGPEGMAKRTGQVQFNNEMLTSAKFIPWRERAKLFDLQSSFALPVKKEDGQLIAIFSVYSRVPNAFGQDELELLGQLSSDLGYGVESLRAKVKLIQEITKNREYLRNASDGVHILDKDLKLIEVSDSFCRMLGCQREEILAKNVSEWDIGVTKNPEMMRHIAQHFEQNKYIQFNTRLRHKDGAAIDVEICAASIFQDEKSVIYCSARDITERKRSEILLKESELRYRTIFEESPNGIVLTRDGYIIDANKVGLKMFGFNNIEEVRGLSLLYFVAPQSRDEMADRVKRRMAGEPTEVDYETIALHKGGSQFPISISATQVVLADGLYAFAHMIDITERRQIEVARQKAFDLLQKIAARVPGMVYQFRMRPDGSSCFPYASDGIRQIYRLAPGDVIENAQQVFTMLYPDDYNGIVDSIEESRRTLKPWRYEYRVRFDDGVVRWLFGNAVPEKENDGSVLWHGFITDITAQKESERERELLAGQLRESQKMEAIGTLAGGIAHDFNNIIATILGNTELALKDVSTDPSAVQVSVGEIRKAALRAREVVQQILSFSRRQPTERKLIALSPVVDEAVRLLRATLPARIVLEVDSAAKLPAVWADAVQIQQIILNLVTNAMQAMQGRPGRIDIILDTMQLNEAMANVQPELRTLYERHRGPTVFLKVSDNAGGMTPTIREKIFEPFFTTKPMGEGTGLGLSVVFGIVKTHEGAIWVDSDLGRGTTFTIHLPAARQQASLAAPAEIKPTAVPGLNINKHILYLDDDEALVFLVKRLLERRGFRVSGFSSQSEALAAVTANPTLFDLVITDYNMPGMSGVDITHAVRLIRADLPVVVTSGFIDETLQAQAHVSGVRKLIFKAAAVEDMCEEFTRLV